jgi:hypothetical protein
MIMVKRVKKKRNLSWLKVEAALLRRFYLRMN